MNAKCKMMKIEQICTKAALSFVLCYILRAPFIEMYVCLYYKDSSVYGPIVSWSPFFDHKLMEFNHPDEWNPTKVPLDELTLLSDNLGRNYLLSYSSAVVSRWCPKVSLSSKQQSLSGLHYPGGLRPSRFITSEFKIFVRFGLAPGFMVNTEIVSSNRRQTPCLVAQQFTKVLQQKFSQYRQYLMLLFHYPGQYSAKNI